MDREQISAITHGDLAFHNPIPEGKVDDALAQVRLAAGEPVLDVGCGRGELLLRLAQRYGADGLGIDSAEVQIERARAEAARRGARIDFVCGAAGAVEAPAGGFALTACIGSSHALGGLGPALARLAGLTRAGGHVLLGDGYWRRPPDPAYLERLGGASPDELPDLNGLLRAGEPHGLAPVYLGVASQDDWNRYEWTLIANGERHGAQPVREWVERARARLLAPGGQETMGFALVLFLKRP